jgi:hypothetical protein
MSGSDLHHITRSKKPGIVTDGERIVERLRERVDIVGWRYESHDEQTGTWTTETILDKDMTSRELRSQNDHIRDLTPLVQFSDVAAILSNRGRPDDSNRVGSLRVNSDEEIARRKRALAATRSRRGRGDVDE